VPLPPVRLDADDAPFDSWHRALGEDALGDAAGVVLRAVIDDDHLAAAGLVFEVGHDFAQGLSDARRFVVSGDDD